MPAIDTCVYIQETRAPVLAHESRLLSTRPMWSSFRASLACKVQKHPHGQLLFEQKSRPMPAVWRSVAEGLSLSRGLPLVLLLLSTHVWCMSLFVPLYSRRVKFLAKAAYFSVLERRADLTLQDPSFLNCRSRPSFSTESGQISVSCIRA